MISAPNKIELSLTVSACLSPIFCLAVSTVPVLAQVPIVPANDGTNTQVTPGGNQFEIHGGQVSGDGANLFHSFQEFGLDTGQTANFLSSPNIENILGRVVGGNPSLIDGMLQVTGGNSNLFLMNPAGIVFGENASLNVPASFAATTATGIGFEDGEFAAFGENRWGELVGAPNSFNFATAVPGAIVNGGNLAVAEGENLGLFAGTVANTGTLEASGGNISVVAVPGENLLRLSAVGNVLSLEVSPTASQNLNQHSGLVPLSLPQLLTGGGEVHADRIAVNADGSISLSGSDILPQIGDAIVSGEVSVAGESADSSTIQVLGNRVAAIDATLDASGVSGGGNILIGGEFQGNGTIPNAEYTFVDSRTSILADALERGDGGRVILWADDTTQFFGNISARGATLSSSDIRLQDLPFPNSALPIPNSNGGFVEVSGKESLVFNGNVNLSAANGSLGTLLLDPENIIISNAPSNPADVEDSLPDIFGDEFEDEEITINADTLTSLTGDIILEATNDITIAPDTSLTFANPEDSDNPGGSIVFRADSDNMDGGIFSMDSGEEIETQGRDISIVAESIDIGSIDTSIEDALGSGSISLEATGDVITRTLITQEGNVEILTPGVIQVSEIRTSGGHVSLGRENLIPESIDIPNRINTVFFDSLTDIERIGSVDLFARDSIQVHRISGNQIALSLENDINWSENVKVSFFRIFGENGEIKLETQGDLVVSDLATCHSNCIFDPQGSLTLDAQGSITLENSTLETLADLTIEAEETVEIIDSIATPVQLNGAGNIYIRGEQSLDIDSLNHPNSLIESANAITLESNGNILGNARFLAEDIFCLAPSCELASIGSDGIISAQGDIEFEDYTGPALKVEARGNITGGNITITEPNDSLSGTDPDIPLLASTPSVVLRAGVAQLQNDPTVSADNDLEIEETTFSSTELPSSPGNINVGNIDTEGEEGNRNGSVILEAAGSILTGSIQTGGSEDQTRNDLGFVSLSAGDDITVDWIDTQAGFRGGDISIETAGLFRAIDSRPFEDSNLHIGSQIEGEQVARIDEIPTSLNASGTPGGTISIQHGGSTFGIGPELTVRDADGNLVFLEIEVVSPDIFVRNAADENGSPVTLTDLDDNPIDLSDPDTDISIDQINLTVEHRPLTLADVPETASFTAGAITSNSANGAPIHSFRDALLTCMGAPPCNTSVGTGAAGIEIDSLSALEAQMPEPSPPPIPEPEITPEPITEPEITPEPSPPPIPEPEITPEPITEPEITPEPSPPPIPEPEITPEPITEPEITPEPSPPPIPEPEITPEPITESTPQPELAPQPVSQPIPEPEIAPEPITEPASQPIPEPSPQPIAESEITPEPITESTLQPEPAPESNPESSDVDVAARVIENTENRSPQSEESPQSACTCPNDRTETSETDNNCNDRTQIPQNCRSQLLQIEQPSTPNNATEIRHENGTIQLRGSGVPATDL